MYVWLVLWRDKISEDGKLCVCVVTSALEG